MTRTPQNIEAERLLLSAALFGTKARVDELAEIVQPDDFYDPIHRVLWSSAIRFAARGAAMTAEGLHRILEQARDVLGADAVNGYVAHLQGGVVVQSAPQLARIVRDFALRRELMAMGQDVTADAAVDDPDRTAEDRIEALEERLFALAERRDDRSDLTMAEVMAATLALIDRAQHAVDGISGLATGLTDLDRRLGGLQAGELYVVAGRPGMGKTAFGLTVAVNAARAGKKVRFVSLEMAAAQLGQRLLARCTGINIQQQRRPLTEEQRRQVDDTVSRLLPPTLTLDDADGQTVAGIRTRARRQKRRGGLDLLVIDYLGLIRPTDPKMPKVYQIEEVTVGLKRLSKELGVPVVLLSQLNRGVEQRDDKRPTLSDLRDSGAIEQDADVVMLLYREEYYLSKEEPTDQQLERLEAVRGKAEVIVAKFRQGEVGTDTVHFDGARQRFETLHRGRP